MTPPTQGFVFARLGQDMVFILEDDTQIQKMRKKNINDRSVSRKSKTKFWT